MTVGSLLLTLIAVLSFVVFVVAVVLSRLRWCPFRGDCARAHCAEDDPCYSTTNFFAIVIRFSLAFFCSTFLACPWGNALVSWLFGLLSYRLW